MFPIPINQRCVVLKGTAHGVGDDWEGPASRVDGLYELSTIQAPLFSGGYRVETVGFKVSGDGPEQIAEPQQLRTLTSTDW